MNNLTSDDLTQNSPKKNELADVKQRGEEFSRGFGEMKYEEWDLTRRTFLKWMGGALTLAGLGGVGILKYCRRPDSLLVPYEKTPEWVIPGKSSIYASMLVRMGQGKSIFVTTHEGRPTKIEPNGQGGVDPFTQASLMDLYSPDRSRNILHFGKKLVGSQQDEFQGAFRAWAEMMRKQAKMGFLFGEEISPARDLVLRTIQKINPNAKFYSWEAVNNQIRRRVEEFIFEKNLRLEVQFQHARRILALDCDFLGLDERGENSHFYDARVPEKGEMNRLYVVESAYSVTGGMADHRLACPRSQIGRFLVALASALSRLSRNEELLSALSSSLKSCGIEPDGEMKYAGIWSKAIGKEPLPVLPELEGVSLQNIQLWIIELAKDLFAHRGSSLVLVGRHETEGIHALGLLLNQVLGAYDSILIKKKNTISALPGLDVLMEDLEAENLDWLALFTPSDLAYHLPQFQKKLKNPKLETLHFGLFANFSAHAAHWHIPLAHGLESWATSLSFDGKVLISQPVLYSLYGACSELEFLLGLIHPQSELLSGELPGGVPSPAYFLVQQAVAQFCHWENDKDAVLFSEKNRIPRPIFNEKTSQIWQNSLKNGFAYCSQTPKNKQAYAPNIRLEKIKEILEAEGLYHPAPDSKKLDLEFKESYSLWDGRYIENPWLQEAPDPITKLTWDNALILAPVTAKHLGILREDELKSGQFDEACGRMVSVSWGEKEILMPVLISPGVARNVAILPIGYGQGALTKGNFGRTQNSQFVGQVGLGSGFDVTPLRGGVENWSVFGGKIKLVSGIYPLALATKNFSDEDRNLIREFSLENAPKEGVGSNPHSALYEPLGSKYWHPLPEFGTGASLQTQAFPFTGEKSQQESEPPLISDRNHQWGMTIDLSRCIGCNACLLACQAENNIPCVGREQVSRGRIMHWMRIDRYFDFSSWENEFSATMLVQPVACAQCELAPCESVCPVNATLHSDDGLNVMAYNRCVGTRYCANNCPYKARRFNFFDFNKRNPYVEGNLQKGPLGIKQVGEAPHLQKNPNVTLRMRGVMEKCTYCTQRIQAAKIRQKRITTSLARQNPDGSVQTEVSWQDLRIPPDSVETACQAACPAKAISFGNLLDQQKASVWQLAQLPRAYDLLEEFGVKPRSVFLARVKNFNTTMPK